MDILATYCLGDGTRVAGHWTLESGDSFLTLPQSQTTLRQHISNGYRGPGPGSGEKQPPAWRLETGGRRNLTLWICDRWGSELLQFAEVI